MSFNTPWQNIRAHGARVQQANENGARHASSYTMIDSNGSGELLHPEVVEFDCTFIQEPIVAHGWALDGDELVKGSYPRVSAGVFRWRTNRRGHYTGAWLFFTVDVPGDLVDPETGNAFGYSINHYFTFSGVAMKDLPDHLLDL